MRKVWSSAIFVAVLLLASGHAVAGLTVSLTVNGDHVGLLPLFQNSGTPDNNAPHQNGLVMVAGLAFNVDQVGGADLFIDTLSVFANKTASEGILETINVAARLLGSQDVNVVIEVFDDFALPVTIPGTPLNISSAFSYVNPGLSSPVSLQSFLDGQPTNPVTVESASDIPATESAVLTTLEYPFELLSRFSFMLRPNTAVAFRAESTATLSETPPTIAHTPEPASLIAWASMLGLAALVYGCQRRR